MQGISVWSALDARIVTRRQPVGSQRQRLAQQEAELDRLIATDARIGGAAIEVGLGERVDYRGSKVGLEVQHVVRNAQPASDATRVLDRVQ